VYFVVKKRIGESIQISGRKKRKKSRIGFCVSAPFGGDGLPRKYGESAFPIVPNRHPMLIA
jgi:hypothetical protein